MNRPVRERRLCARFAACFQCDAIWHAGCLYAARNRDPKERKTGRPEERMTTMKSMMTRWMIAAAALAAVAGSAAAQTYKAEIPLSFHVGSKIMRPGEYRIYTHGNGGGAVFTIYNVDTGTADGLSAARNGRVSKTWQAGVPVLVFECVEGDCMLRELWNGSDGQAFLFPRPRGRSGEARIAVIPLTAVKAD
jgi:hypothetical protein